MCPWHTLPRQRAGSPSADSCLRKGKPYAYQAAPASVLFVHLALLACSFLNTLGAYFFTRFARTALVTPDRPHHLLIWPCNCKCTDLRPAHTRSEFIAFLASAVYKQHVAWDEHAAQGGSLRCLWREA
jgi:hypothetical protein